MAEPAAELPARPLVLVLDAGRSPVELLQTAAAFATRLEAGLHARLAQDPTWARAAALPITRSISRATGTGMGRGILELERRVLVHRTRATLEHVASRYELTCELRVEDGRPGAIAESARVAGSLLLLPAPERAVPPGPMRVLLGTGPAADETVLVANSLAEGASDVHVLAERGQAVRLAHIELLRRSSGNGQPVVLVIEPPATTDMVAAIIQATPGGVLVIQRDHPLAAVLTRSWPEPALDCHVVIA